MFGTLDKFNIEKESVLTVETFIQTSNIHTRRKSNHKIVFFTVTSNTPWTIGFLPYDQVTLDTLYGKKEGTKEIRGRFYGPFWINVSNWKPKDSDPYFTERKDIQALVFDGTSGFLSCSDVQEYYDRVHPRDSTKASISRWLGDPTLLYILNHTDVTFGKYADRSMTLNGLIHTFNVLVSSTGAELDYSKIYCRLHAVYSTIKDGRILPMPIHSWKEFAVLFPRFYFNELRSGIPYDPNGNMGEVQRYRRVSIDGGFQQKGVEIKVSNLTIKVRVEGWEPRFQRYVNEVMTLTGVKPIAKEVAGDDVRLELESQVAALKNKVKELEDANASQDYKKTIEALQKRIKELEPLVNEKNALRLELDLLRLEKNDSDHTKEEIERLSGINQKLNLRIQEVEKVLEQCRAKRDQLMLELENEVVAKDKIRNSSVMENEEYLSKIKAMADKNEFTEQQRRLVIEELKLSKSKIKTLESSIDRLNSESAQLETRLKSKNEELERSNKAIEAFVKANDEFDRDNKRLKDAITRQREVITRTKAILNQREDVITALERDNIDLLDVIDKKDAKIKNIERKYAALGDENDALKSTVDKLMVQVNNHGYMRAFTKLSNESHHDKRFVVDDKATWRSLASKNMFHNTALFRFSDVQLDPEDFYDPSRMGFSTKVVYQEIRIENLPVSISDNNGNIRMFDDQSIMRNFLGCVNRTKFDLCLPLWIEDDVVQPSEYVRVFNHKGYLSNYPYILPHGTVYVEVPTFGNMKAVVNYDFRNEIKAVPNNASTWMVSNIQKMTIDSIGNIKTVACLMMKIRKYKADDWLKLDRVILCSYEK